MNHRQLPTTRVNALLRTLRPVLALALMLAATLMLGGCKGGSRSTATLEEATNAYIQGRFQESYAKAEKVADDNSGIVKDRAALIAGQSAHALGNRVAAERWLRPLTTHGNDEINGNANATLGLSAFNQRQWALASVMLSAAATRLSGDDAARSAMYAGDSFEQLGQTIKARSMYQRALQTAADAGLKRSIQDRLVQGPYTIQLGAFSSRTSADQTARAAASKARAAALPAPVIVVTNAGPGNQLFAVQVGTFASRAAAESARVRSRLDGVVIAAPRN
ncbi:MAG: SPOR domain-containing protein [Phycisphaerales bacterium]|nr:SPOR domain-containing protein [Phycisphaerales bacterium]